MLIICIASAYLEKADYLNSIKALKKVLHLTANEKDFNFLRGIVHNELGMMFLQDEVDESFTFEQKVYLAYNNFVIAMKYGNKDAVGKFR